MPATSKVQVIIDAKDNASRVLKGFQGSLNTLGRSASNLGADFRTLGKIAIGAGIAMGALAFKAGMSAARVEELTFALHAVAKANDISQQAVDDTVNSLRNMNIAHAKALQVTALFVQSQLDLADATKIANAAKDLAVIAGLDSSEATETLTRAIVMQRPMLLKQFGIVKGLDQIYKDYAETTGVTAHELTQLEKRQAFLNTILEAGGKVAGTYEAAMDSVSKRFRSLTGRIIPDFMAQIGKAFAPALTIGIDAISNSIGNMSTWITENQDKIAQWGESIGKVVAKGIGIFGKLVNFLLNNKEIILGVFVVMAIGVGALVVAFVTAHAAIMVVIAGVITVVTLLAKAWNSNFLGIQSIIMNFVNNFKRGIEQIKIAVDWLETYVLPHIKAFFENILKALQAMANRFSIIWNWIKNSVVSPVVKWFMTYVWPTISTVFRKIKTAATNLWKKIEEVFDWIKDKVETVINFIRDLIDGFKPKIEIGLSLPDIGAAWENLKEKARNLGANRQTGGMIPGPIGSPVPIVAHAGERVIPAGVSPAPIGGGTGGIVFEVNIGMYVGTETEKRNIARELYGALVQVAQAQNKSVGELMGEV